MARLRQCAGFRSPGIAGISEVQGGSLKAQACGSRCPVPEAKSRIHQNFCAAKTSWGRFAGWADTALKFQLSSAPVGPLALAAEAAPAPMPAEGPAAPAALPAQQLTKSAWWASVVVQRQMWKANGPGSL